MGVPLSCFEWVGDKLLMEKEINFMFYFNYRYYSFGHEIGHMYGCFHNREEGKINEVYPTAYGFLMRPPVESGKRTILA